MDDTARPADSSCLCLVEAVARHASRPADRRRCNRCNANERSMTSCDDCRARAAANDAHVRSQEPNALETAARTM
eukprot:2091302-Prymnesium_polylepis.2